MNQRTITLEINPQAFFGEQNINIETLKNYFSKLKIVARGNQIIAFGEEEILDEFGKLLINDILDRYYKNIDYIVENGYKNPTMLHYNELFLKLNEKEKRNLIQFILENINSVMFDFLDLFEQNEKFKLVYEEDQKQINLVEISEMLKAEPLGENGWIERFSKYAKEKE